jgi:tetratricopeptide (TPR) repeat protein
MKDQLKATIKMRHFWITSLCSSLLLSMCAPAVVRSNNAGNERFAAGAYDEAISEYRRAQAEEPDRAEPYYNASNAYNRQAQLNAALTQAQQALKTADPDLAAKSWYNLGNAFFDAKRWSEAIAAYQQALRINAGNVDAKHNLELALKNLEEQQEHQKQQDREIHQDHEVQGSENSFQSQTNPATPTPAGQSETSGERDQSAPAPSRETKYTDGMTPEQALQLLQALVGASETLQERLQQIHRFPGPPPERDW